MLGLVGIRPSKKLSADRFPVLAPKAKQKSTKTPRQVFLEPELWEALSKVAAFQTAAWKTVDKKNLSLSRNHVIETLLTWAVASYWEEKKGEPPDQEGPEWQRAVAALAARIERDEARKAKSQSEDQS